MKKRIIYIFSLILLIFGLASCNTKNGINIGNKKVVAGKELSYNYSDSYTKEIRKKMRDFEGMLDVTDNYENILATWNEINNYAYALYSYSNVEFVNFAITADMKSSMKESKYNDIFNEISEWQNKMYEPISKSIYKDQFFEGMTEEEIKDLIDNAFPSSYYEYDTTKMELLAEYYNIKDNEFTTKVPYLYIRYIENAKKLAKSAGYESYVDYMYDYEYKRDYTPMQVQKFYGYVKSYIVPLFDKLYNKMMEVSSSLLPTTYMQYMTFANDFNIEENQRVASYASYMGEKYNSTYTNLWDNGYYYFSNEKKSMEGAFTTYLYTENQPVLYFGPGYQSELTVVHEFGHYYAMSIGQGNFGSLDMAETHSQGNEMLYLSYLDKFDIINDALSRVYEAESLINACVSIIISAIIDEFEQECFKAEKLYAKDLDPLFKQICDKYIGYDKLSSLFSILPEDYWRMVVVENSCYYISYAMSLIPSLYFYISAHNDFDNAKTTYLGMIDKLETEEVVFLEVLDEYNIFSPFDEEAYKEIANLDSYI